MDDDDRGRIPSGESPSAESGDSPSAEPAVKRRLTDKIGDAISHATEQGRKMVADKLRLIHETIVSEETEAGHRRRADDELEKYLGRYIDNVRNRRIRAYKARPM